MSPASRRNWARLVRIALISLIALPWLPALLGGVPWLARPCAILDGWFALHCQRDPARGLPGLAVCLRCYGIYFGLGFGALVLRPRLAPFRVRVWVLCAALVMLLDVATELLGMRSPYAPLRFVTGALLGYPVGLSLALALRREPG
ncbi:MAG TPA: DUF2085 domain-containing protein [Polyangiaceae bacterium]|jgi:uncharacterized membrane protein|nr:DUF2085 domain-containing protein [Polyangiaceae bacterium]